MCYHYRLVAYISQHAELCVVDKPSPPRNLQVPAYGVDSADLKWDIPESDGGEPITEYIVEKRDVTKTAYISQGKTDVNTLTLKATKLIEGNQYLFRVAAVNSVGQSDWVELAEPVTAKQPFNPPGMVMYGQYINPGCLKGVY